jgi:hypothetical protein
MVMSSLLLMWPLMVSEAPIVVIVGTFPDE